MLSRPRERLPSTSPLPAYDGSAKWLFRMSLDAFGWNEHWAAAFAPHAAAGLEPGRVVCELRRRFYAVQLAEEEVLGECLGGYFHRARAAEAFPAVGDWVAVQRRPGESRADIQAVLPRRTKFSRRAAGEADLEQLVAANIDRVLLVSGLDQNYNPARIQRFLVAARESGAEPIVVLNKTDVVDEPERVRDELQQLLPDVRLILTSIATRRGLKALTALAEPGLTLAFIGSSGVGKSSLINALVRDEALPTGEVREKDSKGRHTTTRRELVCTPSGALVIDTPGLRELKLWEARDGVNEAFADIAALAQQCRFSNCSHSREPGCAVRAAIEAGKLSPERLANFQKLSAEQAARTLARRKSSSSVANRPGWRQRQSEPRRSGRIHPED